MATCTICSPHTGDGIYAVNSSNLQIGTGADCPNTNPCNDLTCDDGFGIWLVDTHDVVINRAAIAKATTTTRTKIQGPPTPGRRRACLPDSVSQCSPAANSLRADCGQRRSANMDR